MKDIIGEASVQTEVLPDGRMIADLTPSQLASALAALGIAGVSASDGRLQLITSFNDYLSDIAAEAGRVAVEEWFREVAELPAPAAPEPPAVPDNDDDD